MMTERMIEEQLVRGVKRKKGLCLKLHPLTVAGLPDRLILLPGGQCAFVEVKRTGEKLRPIQVKRMNDLKRLGFHCFILDALDQIPHILEEVEASGI